MTAYYKYKADKDYSFYCGELKGVSFENQWCSIKDCLLTIKKDYAWDGCSPKKRFKFFGLSFVLGTLDGNNDQCKWASGVHDIFCQFIDLIDVTKATVLAIFERMLRQAKWWLWRQYVWAVDKFGPQNFKGGLI